jgi:hypothetical protein
MQEDKMQYLMVKCKRQATAFDSEHKPGVIPQIHLSALNSDPHSADSGGFFLVEEAEDLINETILDSEEAYGPIQTFLSLFELTLIQLLGELGHVSLPVL